MSLIWALGVNEHLGTPMVEIMSARALIQGNTALIYIDNISVWYWYMTELEVHYVTPTLASDAIFGQ